MTPRSIRLSMGWLNSQPCDGSGYFNEIIYPSLVREFLLLGVVSWPNLTIAQPGRGGVIADIDQLPFSGDAFTSI